MAFFVSHKPKSVIRFTPNLLRLCFEQIATSVLETIADYGETRTASLSFLPTAIPRNTDTQLLLRHESLPSLIIVEDTDFGILRCCLSKLFTIAVVPATQRCAVGPTYQLQMRSVGRVADETVFPHQQIA